MDDSIGQIRFFKCVPESFHHLSTFVCYVIGKPHGCVSQHTSKLPAWLQALHHDSSLQWRDKCTAVYWMKCFFNIGQPHRRQFLCPQKHSNAQKTLIGKEQHRNDLCCRTVVKRVPFRLKNRHQYSDHLKEKHTSSKASFHKPCTN